MVHEATVHNAIACLLEQRPPRLFLMLASRREPPFSLARLRGQGQLHEIRPDDLRFTREETATFCNTLMQLDLPPAQLTMLESRTEAGLSACSWRRCRCTTTPTRPDSSASSRAMTVTSPTS